MNIEEFISNFNDIIPYQFLLKVGGYRADKIINNKSFVSSENRKGRAYPFYRKGLFETTTDYIPLEKVDVPIELTIRCSYPHSLKWEKQTKSTNKGNSSFEVRLLNKEENKQFGYLSLDLTPAGDIKNKFCAFYNERGTHEISQFIWYDYDEQTRQVISKENLSFVFYHLETGLEERLSFYKEEGVLKGITISKDGIKNHAFDSIVWSDNDLTSYLFSRYCNHAKVEYASPLVCDMTNYIINKDFIGDLASTNSIFGGFYGEYIGNTVIKIDSKMVLLIETLKDNEHYFTPIDITNTDAFDIDFYYEREDGTRYYQAIKDSDKKPILKVKIENGEEVVVVPLEEQNINNEFINFVISQVHDLPDFHMVESKKLATLSLPKYAYENQKKGPVLVKRSKKSSK